MNKLSWGSLAIILGSILLSLELYGLRFLSETISMDVDALLKYDDPIRYSILIMIALIIYGLVLVIIHFIEEYKKH